MLLHKNQWSLIKWMRFLLMSLVFCSQPMLAAGCGRETMNSFLKARHCKRMSVIILSSNYKWSIEVACWSKDAKPRYSISYKRKEFFVPKSFIKHWLFVSLLCRSLVFTCFHFQLFAATGAAMARWGAKGQRGGKDKGWES